MIIFGILISITSYELAAWSDMWYSRSMCKYIESTGIGKIDLTRPMFDNLWSFIWFSRHHHPRTEGVNIKEWQMVDDHIEKSNCYRLERLSLPERLFADESFGRWYGLGGYWVNLSISKYV